MANPHPHHDGLLAALDRAKSQSRLAEICGCTQGNIWQLKRNGSALPAHFVLSVEAELGIPRHELRPDIYPPAEQVRTQA
jgi:DNA-binding transcriptional regulator YdaS (Cro superfamily)